MIYRTRGGGVYSWEEMVAYYSSAAGDELGALKAQALGQQLGYETARKAIEDGDRPGTSDWTTKEIRKKMTTHVGFSAIGEAFVGVAHGTLARQAVYEGNFVYGFRKKWREFKEWIEPTDVGTPMNVFDVL